MCARLIHINIQMKYIVLGHGWCNTVSRSVTLNISTQDEQVVAKQCWNLLVNELHVDETIVRAVGIHLTKLNHRAITQGGKQLMPNNNRSIQSMFERNNNKSNRIRNSNNNKKKTVCLKLMKVCGNVCHGILKMNCAMRMISN
eukprot:516225_1